MSSVPSLLPPPLESASHRHDRIKHHGHHWIEEGTYDDFKWNILSSDLPEFGIALVGTCYHYNTSALLGYKGATFIEEGTVITPPGALFLALEGAPYDVDVYVHQTGLASVDKKVLEMLLARPEVVRHEPKEASPRAQGA
jgi:hypothetical protein